MSVAKNMKDLGLPMETIMNATGLSEKEIAAL